MRKSMKIKGGIFAAFLIAAIGSSAFTAHGGETDFLISQGPGAIGLEELRARKIIEEKVGMFDVNRFALPQDAGMLVLVEGEYGPECGVYVYEKTENGWELRIKTSGHMGLNGMSSSRTAGDKTTPIGVFQMNTPFGQADALPGFPSGYIQVDEDYVWEDETNELSRNTEKEGEKVGTEEYRGCYDYVIDLGFNPGAVKDKGSALFLHCEGEHRGYTSGCVAIEKDIMADVMRLYGKYGDGRCYSALAPAGTIEQIYGAYGANGGLSPDGDFK